MCYVYGEMRWLCVSGTDSAGVAAGTTPHCNGVVCAKRNISMEMGS